MNAFRTSYARARLAARRSMGLVPNDDEMAAIDERDATVRPLAELSPRQRSMSTSNEGHFVFGPDGTRIAFDMATETQQSTSTRRRRTACSR